MDEFTSIGVWLIIITISINSGLIYLSAQQGLVENGLMPNINKNSYFNTTFDYSIPEETSGNTITSSEPTISGSWLNDMINVAVMIGNSVRLILTAWTDLLSAVLAPVPGGAFFANIVLPIIGWVQIISFFIIGVRVAGVIRGVI